MKKYFFILTALAVLCSCSKDGQEIPGQPADERNVTVSLSCEPLYTRGFFDDTAAAETWEKKIHTAVVLIFDQGGDLLLRHDLSAAEAASGRAYLSVPALLLRGEELDFYAVANYTVGGDVTTLEQLQNLPDIDLDEYNHPAADFIMYSSKRSQGFVMSGSVRYRMPDYGQTADISIFLKRNVAKIAVRYTVSPDFYFMAGGDVMIESISIRQAASKAYVVEDNGIPAVNGYYGLRQNPSQDGALFYVYPSEEGNYPYVEIIGDFMHSDGHTSHVSFAAPLEGSGNGVIERNGYYRIDVMIGMEWGGVEWELAAKDWNSPLTQKAYPPMSL